MSHPAGYSDSDSENSDSLLVCGFSPKSKRFPVKTFQPSVPSTKTTTSTYADDGWGDDEDWTAPAPQPASEEPVDRLVHAIEMKDVKLATELFQENKIKVNGALEDGWTLLLKAARVACVPLIDLFIHAGADTGQSSPGGHTCLMALTSWKNNLTDSIEAAKILLQNDANVNACDIHGNTPLMLAVTERRAELARVYLDAGASIDEQNNSGKTALFMAAELGYGQEVRLLLSWKANPRLEPRDRYSSEVDSAEVEHQEVFDLIFLVDTTKWIPGLDPALKDEPSDRPKREIFQDKRQAEAREMELSQIEMILARLGLGTNATKFEKHDLVYTDFIRLTEDDLIEIGIAPKGRAKILNAIEDIQNRDWSNAKALPVNLQKCISSAESVCLLNSIDLHLRLINKSIENLESSIRQNPQGLECGIEMVSVEDVVKRIDNAEVSLTELTKGLQALEKALSSMDINTRSHPTSNAIKSSFYNKWTATGCVFALLIGGLLFSKPTKRILFRKVSYHLE